MRRPVGALVARRAAQAGVPGAVLPPEVVPQEVGLRAVERRPGAAQRVAVRLGARELVPPLETPRLVAVCRAMAQPVEQSRVVPRAG